ISQAYHARRSVQGFAESLGLPERVTGYAYHSVPVALYAWLCSPNKFRLALESALDCGGDTDTVAAIVGALTGISAGVRNIPPEWIHRLCEWPRSVKVLQQVADRLARQRRSNRPLGRVRYFWPGLLPRNIVFLLVVLLHGFR